MPISVVLYDLGMSRLRTK